MSSQGNHHQMELNEFFFFQNQTNDKRLPCGYTVCNIKTPAKTTTKIKIIYAWWCAVGEVIQCQLPPPAAAPSTSGVGRSPEEYYHVMDTNIFVNSYYAA